MARYVLLEFADNAEADAFVLKQMDKTLKGATRRVVGYFFRPTKFCECGPIPQTKLKTEVTLGARFGVRVHRTCRRPRREVGCAPRNLLDPADSPIKMRTAFLTIRGESQGKGMGGTLQANYPITVIEETRIMEMRKGYGQG